MLTYMGLKIIENPMLTKTIEDWSRVRSHGRARRRRWKHRQNIKIVTVPSDQFYLTGDTYAKPNRMLELESVDAMRLFQLLKWFQMNLQAETLCLVHGLHDGE